MKIIIFALLLFVALGCGSDSAERTPSSNYEHNFKRVDSIKYISDSLLVFDTLNKYIDKDKQYAIYVMDSRCSVCIVEFIEFCKEVSSLDVVVIAVLKPFNKLTVEYFVEKADKSLLNKIIFVENNPKVFLGDLGRYDKTVYAIDNGEILNRFNHKYTYDRKK